MSGPAAVFPILTRLTKHELEEFLDSFPRSCGCTPGVVEACRRPDASGCGPKPTRLTALVRASYQCHSNSITLAYAISPTKHKLGSSAVTKDSIAAIARM